MSILTFHLIDDALNMLRQKGYTSEKISLAIRDASRLFFSMEEFLTSDMSERVDPNSYGMYKGLPIVASRSAISTISFKDNTGHDCFMCICAPMGIHTNKIVLPGEYEI
jgi:hypothetical protein